MDYLPTLGEKWLHSRGNVGKYSLHGAFGNGKVGLVIPKVQPSCPQSQVALLLPSLGPCAFTVDEALNLARSNRNNQRKTRWESVENAQRCRFCVFVWGVLIFVGGFCCGMCCVLLLAGDMYVLFGDVVLVGVLVPNTKQAKLFREQLVFDHEIKKSICCWSCFCCLCQDEIDAMEEIPKKKCHQECHVLNAYMYYNFEVCQYTIGDKRLLTCWEDLRFMDTFLKKQATSNCSNLPGGRLFGQIPLGRYHFGDLRSTPSTPPGPH